MNNLKIRKVSKSDLEACYEIERKCFPEAEAASKENIKKRMDVFPEGFYVAEADGDIVGMVNSSSINQETLADEEIKTMGEHDDEGDNLVVISLLVKPEYQKKGVSRKLLNRIVDEAKNQEKKNVMLMCKDYLIDYYRKYGFECKCKSGSNHGGAQWFEMVRKLAA